MVEQNWQQQHAVGGLWWNPDRGGWSQLFKASLGKLRVLLGDNEEPLKVSVKEEEKQTRK